MNFPNSFISRISKQLGENAKAFFDALENEPPVSIRSNPAKLSQHLKGEKVPWCGAGLYLQQRPSFTLDPLFHAGCYYVQEAASMFIEQVFKQLHLNKKKLLVLDACAAPGGKSTHLASLISEDSLLISNEAISSRISALKENIIKWGTGNVVITNNDPSSFSNLKGLFNIILVDAPCSGEGLFRKDKGAIEEWSEHNCSLCVSRQKRILSSLLPSLCAGGTLIYCTCTYNPAENENNVKWLVEEFDMECVPLVVDEDWGIVCNQNERGISTFSFYPHRTKSEGFFISVLRKKSEEYPVNIRTRPKKFLSLNRKHHSIKEMITSEKENLFSFRNKIILFPSQWINLLEFLSQSLKINYAGTDIAEIKADDIIPQHGLAMSVNLNKETFPTVQLSHEEALNYLRKEMVIPQGQQKGWLLAEYQQTPLGWLKAVGNRLNNYYPVEWRIRKR